MTDTTATSEVNNGINTIPKETTEAQLGAFLKEHQEIEMVAPVIIGVLATSRFQLRGAKALLVNLLVASLTRQVFTQLKKLGENETISPPQTATESNVQDNENECSLIHFVPGRIRLRVPRVRDNRHFALYLEQRLIAEETVTSVRVNQAAASATITYKRQEKSDLAMSSYFVTIIQQRDNEHEG
ncbi:MAG: metal ABC transporter ATPase [Cyanobacteria bacterium SBLK]|nr:metal ABC transporter ATPase [Cyanobacteria bacterium SBLK]